uniref:RNA-dependent RNA polymerase n=1 Tax=Plasmopara viticola lesion associated mitovirus 13 TaxID=2719438 RepID=A0A6G9RV96_9VIRU|nr:RNA-dependent RNA polymerase [Plasmopara viticola lesion associated mitovirus 13]
MNFIHNLIRFNRKEIKDKQWLSFREVRPFLMVVLWVTNTKGTPFANNLYILEKRLLDIWRCNGSTFLFNYMKGMLHITIRYFALTPINSTFNSKVLVKVNGYTNLPSIFPKELSALIHSWNRSTDLKYIVALLSFIGIFRSLKTEVPVSLKTIEDPFSGKSETISEKLLKEILNKWMGIYKIPNSPAKTFYSNKAGPNSHTSLWGAEIDCFALISEWSVFKPYIRYMWVSRSYFLLSWYIIVIILGSPYYIVSRLFSMKPCNGRLSVVYNQAGKARVVAMTNWWIQCCFKGLHENIFNILRGMTCDATFDQKGSLKLFIERCQGKKFFCYDLSAATDRLPVVLQKDILNILRFQGNNWSDIITNIRWKYKSNLISYSVGQPMGAYSSWAMLALTHHVIVLVSAKIAGKDKSFKDYIVLGDDIVIADEDVAKAYLEIMDMLGVSINLSKSIVSTEIVEFAKCWVNPNYDISPIGSGLIVQSIRDKVSFISLVAQAWERGLLSWLDVWQGYKKSPKVIRPKVVYCILHTTLIKVNAFITKSLNDNKLSINDLFSKQGRLSSKHTMDVLMPMSVKTHMLDKIFLSQDLEVTTLRGIAAVLETEADMILKRNLVSTYVATKQLLFYSWRTSTLRIGMPDLFDLLLLPIKPAIWIHMRLIIKSLVEICYWYWITIRIHISDYFLPSLTYGQKLLIYSQLVDLNSRVHFYEEEIIKKKELSKFYSRITNDYFGRQLPQYLKNMDKQRPALRKPVRMNPVINMY